MKRQLTSRQEDCKRQKLECKFCKGFNCDSTMSSSPRVDAFRRANPLVVPCTVPISLTLPLFVWQCDACPHSFEMACANVHDGYWCPYCAGRALCGSESCEICFQKSVASHSRSVSFLAANRSANLLTVSLQSPDIYKWLCFECDLTFQASCRVVLDGEWCTCENELC